MIAITESMDIVLVTKDLGSISNGLRNSTTVPTYNLL